MPTNKKPALIVLIDGEKREKFSELCARKERPMAWAVNVFIDQCLKNDEITFSPSEPSNHPVSESYDAEGFTELRAMMIDIKECLQQISVHAPLKDGVEVNEEIIEAPVDLPLSEVKKAREEIKMLLEASLNPQMRQQLPTLFSLAQI